MNDILLNVVGEVASPRQFSFADLAAIDPTLQISDVSQIANGRQGAAVQLAAILALVQPKPTARYLNLHSAADNFHASIPLTAVAGKAIVIYRLNDQPLSPKAGGPIRFFIPNHSACHSTEIDECANVKFVDTLELTNDKGFDNRPHDDQEHANLHAQSNLPGK